jgi:O-antigen/teichoic acid export membrane protein
VKPRIASPPGRHLLDGTVRVLLAEALLPLTGLVTAAFLTRRLGPDGYGVLTLAATIVAGIEASITAVFSRAAIKFVSEADDWRPVGTTVVRLYLGVSAGAALLLWLLALPVAALLDEPQFSTYLRLFACQIPLFSLAQAHRNVLIGLGEFRQRAVASAGRWIARLVLIIALVELGLGVPGAILGSLGGALVELLINRFYVRPSLTSAAPFPARLLWRYAAPLSLSTLSLTIYMNLDLLALKTLGGTAAEAGLLGASRSLSLVPGLLAFACAPLLLATLSRALHAGEREQARTLARQALRVTVGLVPFAGLSAGAAGEIVEWLFGPPFSGAAPLLAVLMFAALAGVIIVVVTAILTAVGRPGGTIVFTGPLVPLAIAGHLLLIPGLGALGAALVSLSVSWIGALMAVLTVYRLWHILPPTGTLWRSVLAGGAAYALAALWPTPGFLLLVKLPTIGLLIPLLFVGLGELNAGEFRNVRSLIRWSTAPAERRREA